MNHYSDNSNLRPRYPENELASDDYRQIDELLGGGCNCNHSTDNVTDCGLPEFSENIPQAMVYSPHQCFDMLYDPDTALERGTLFRALDLPFGGASLLGE